MKKNSKNNSISLLVMIIISVFTQILTIVKSSAVAGIFGLSAQMDAYNFANSIVSLIFGLIAGGITTIVIPSYVKKEDENKINSFLTFIYGLLFMLIVVIIIFRYQIVGIFSNRDEMFINICSNILIILLLSQYLMSITNITVAYFQSEGKYNVPKIINLVSQLMVVIYLLFKRDISIYTYTYIIAIGILINFILDIYFAIKIKWKFKININFKINNVRKTLLLFLPIVFSSSIYNISLFLDTIIASGLDVGKLSILSYSNQISGIVNTVLIGNLIIYAYPKVIRQIANDNQKYFWNQVNLFQAIIILAFVGFIAIGQEGISLLFEYGLFNKYATLSVYYGTSLYLIGMQFNVIRDLIYRFFYAKENTKIPSTNSFFVSLINIVLSIILVRFIGLYGIILGTVLSSFISMIMIFIKLKKFIKIQLSLKTIFLNFIKNNAIGFITLLIVLMTKKYIFFGNKILTIIILGIETILLFIVLMFFINKKIIYNLKDI